MLMTFMLAKSSAIGETTFAMIGEDIKPCKLNPLPDVEILTASHPINFGTGNPLYLLEFFLSLSEAFPLSLIILAFMNDRLEDGKVDNALLVVNCKDLVQVLKAGIFPGHFAKTGHLLRLLKSFSTSLDARDESGHHMQKNSVSSLGYQLRMQCYHAPELNRSMEQSVAGGFYMILLCNALVACQSCTASHVNITLVAGLRNLLKCTWDKNEKLSDYVNKLQAASHNARVAIDNYGKVCCKALQLAVSLFGIDAKFRLGKQWRMKGCTLFSFRPTRTRSLEPIRKAHFIIEISHNPPTVIVARHL
ncbi:hypothetical protein MP228_003329 [Amoeboaphelidium protococcarum]|nr:hypothetical protein MP228_003329 [Amoeboaphelidium protococcarum]